MFSRSPSGSKNPALKNNTFITNPKTYRETHRQLLTKTSPQSTIKHFRDRIGEHHQTHQILTKSSSSIPSLLAIHYVPTTTIISTLTITMTEIQGRKGSENVFPMDFVPHKPSTTNAKAANSDDKKASKNEPKLSTKNSSEDSPEKPSNSLSPSYASPRAHDDTSPTYSFTHLSDFQNKKGFKFAATPQNSVIDKDNSIPPLQCIFDAFEVLQGVYGHLFTDDESHVFSRHLLSPTKEKFPHISIDESLCIYTTQIHKQEPRPLYEKLKTLPKPHFIATPTHMNFTRTTLVNLTTQVQFIISILQLNAGGLVPFKCAVIIPSLDPKAPTPCTFVWDPRKIMTSLAKYTFCIHKYSKGHQSQVSSDLSSILEFPNELPYDLLIFYLSSHCEWEYSGGDDIEGATTILDTSNLQASEQFLKAADASGDGDGMETHDDNPSVIRMEIHGTLLLGDIITLAHKLVNSFIYAPPEGQTTDTEHCAIPKGAIQKRSMVTLKGYTRFDVEVLSSELASFLEAWRKKFPLQDTKPLVLLFPIEWTLQPASLIVSPSLALKGTDVSPLDLFTTIMSIPLIKQSIKCALWRNAYSVILYVDHTNLPRDAVTPHPFEWFAQQLKEYKYLTVHAKTMKIPSSNPLPTNTSIATCDKVLQALSTPERNSINIAAPMSCSFREIMRTVTLFGQVLAIKPHCDSIPNLQLFKATYLNPSSAVLAHGEKVGSVHFSAGLNQNDLKKNTMIKEGMDNGHTRWDSILRQTSALGALKALQAAKTSLAIPFSHPIPEEGPRHEAKHTQSPSIPKSTSMTSPQLTAAPSHTPKTPSSSARKPKPSPKSDFKKKLQKFQTIAEADDDSLTPWDDEDMDPEFANSAKTPDPKPLQFGSPGIAQRTKSKSKPLKQTPPHASSNPPGPSPNKKKEAPKKK